MNGEEHPHDRLQRERAGVAGDPVPDHEYGDDPEDVPGREEYGSHSRPCPDDDCDGTMHPTRNRVRWDCNSCDEWLPMAYGDSWQERVSGTTAGRVEALTSPGLLTEKQALAYVLRDVNGLSREQAAEVMGVSVSTQDTHATEARRKVGKARAVATVVEDLRDDETTRCDGCGTMTLPDERTEHRPQQRAYTVAYCDDCEEYREQHGVRVEDHDQYQLRDDSGGVEEGDT